MNRGLALLALGTLAACSPPPSGLDPVLMHYNFYKDYESRETALNKAFAKHLSGRSRPEAIARLQDFGFFCAETSCSLETHHKETWAEKHFGISNSAKGMRNHHATCYVVTFTGDPQTDPTALTARRSHQTTQRPWTQPQEPPQPCEVSQ